MKIFNFAPRVAKRYWAATGQALHWRRGKNTFGGLSQILGVGLREIICLGFEGCNRLLFRILRFFILFRFFLPLQAYHKEEISEDGSIILHSF